MTFIKLENGMKYWTTIDFWSDYAKLTAKPEWKLAVITCMDCRITSRALGTADPGKMVVIRNAGALITKDSLRSLLVAIYELGVEDVAIIGHTQCGGQMDAQKMNELLEKISIETRLSPRDVLRHMDVTNVAEAFLGFKDVFEQVRQSLESLRQHPLIPKSVEIRGYVYDTKTGKFHRILSNSVREL